MKTAIQSLLIAILLILSVLVGTAQTKDSTDIQAAKKELQEIKDLQVKPSLPGTALKSCDTCKIPDIILKNTSDFTQNYFTLSPHTTLQYDNTVKMKISGVDSNGQKTGWFDKRYVKMTSDSTFVILPKSK